MKKQIAILAQLLFTTILSVSTFNNTQAQTTVKIGTQIWTTKNLDVSVYRNGDTIPEVKDRIEWGKLTTGAWCYYGNRTEIGSSNGKFYNWYAVNDPRGLAPEGYHIPSQDEWNIVTEFLGGKVAASKKMKTATGWDDNGNGDNSSGFSALPIGLRVYNGMFDFIGGWGCFWSSTDDAAIGPMFYELNFSNGIVIHLPHNKRQGFSVRCIKD